MQAKNEGQKSSSELDENNRKPRGDHQYEGDFGQGSPSANVDTVEGRKGGEVGA